MSLNRLKQNLKKDLSNLAPISLVLMGDTPTQLINIAIRGKGVDEGYNISVFEAPYNQIEFQLFNASSEVYTLKPKFIVISESSEKLQQRFYKLSAEEKSNFYLEKIDQVRNYIDNINDRIQTTIIYSNFVEINDAVFGNYNSKTDLSFLTQLRRINLGLVQLSQEFKNLVINDLSSLQNNFGRNYTHSATLFANTGMNFSVDFLPHFATNVVDVIKTSQGKFKKCLILDLDNTLWGGIIGDDGVEGIQLGNLGIGETFSRFQTWIKQLQLRGIILAVCSKNSEKIATQPFLEHPDMVLRLDDIAVFVANWENKVDNVRHIQEILNIGFDSMVFIDDNPVERKIVRDNIPDVLVPELPEDPAEYQSFLQQLNLFDTSSIADFDANRTLMYREEAKRYQQKKSFTNESDFLKSLQMKVAIEPFQSSDVPRISELSQRSNQFNLRTIRYSETEIAAMPQEPNLHCFTFKMIDLYGNYGLVSMVVLKNLSPDELFIDTWIMSCRVLKRGLENVVLNKIAAVAKEIGASKLVGEYIPTLKNELVKNHYKDMGFEAYKFENQWVYILDNYQNRNHHIELELCYS